MKGIKEQLKDKSIGGVYLLYGEEDYLKDFYTEKITEFCSGDGPDEFNILKLTNQKPDNNAMAEFIVSLPFMSDKKLLVLKNTGLFSKTSEADKKFWCETFSDLPDYMVIVFCESTVDKRSALYKLIADKHTAEEFPLSKEADLINWFARIMAAEGKTMTKDDISFVIENVGQNMYLLKREAEKLASFTANGPSLIPSEDVQACICKSLEGKVFTIIDNIVALDKSKVIGGIRDLKILTDKSEPVKVLSLIARQFSTLRKIKILQSSLTVAEIARCVKTKEYFVKKYISQLKNFTVSDLDRAIELCSAADAKIKSGQAESWLTLETLAVALMEK